MNKEVVSKKDIHITVGMNSESIPVSIEWTADGAPKDNPSCKGLILSLLNKESLDTLRIDLWTQDMQIYEMDRFVFHTLQGIADTYVKATNNTALGNEMRAFIEHFGKSTQILAEKKS